MYVRHLPLPFLSPQHYCFLYTDSLGRWCAKVKFSVLSKSYSDTAIRSALAASCRWFQGKHHTQKNTKKMKGSWTENLMVIMHQQTTSLKRFLTKNKPKALMVKFWTPPVATNAGVLWGRIQQGFSINTTYSSPRAFLQGIYMECLFSDSWDFCSHCNKILQHDLDRKEIFYVR